MPSGKRGLSVTPAFSVPEVRNASALWIYINGKKERKKKDVSGFCQNTEIVSFLFVCLFFRTIYSIFHYHFSHFKSCGVTGPSWSV